MYVVFGSREAECWVPLCDEMKKLKDKGTHRLEGHGQPADLAAVHSHRPVGELARQQVGLRERVAVGVEQRQNRRQFVSWTDQKDQMRDQNATSDPGHVTFFH